jgi:surface protein
MKSTFENTHKFNGDISLWNVSKVKDMSYMFKGSKVFNSDISKWNVSSVTNMSHMFYETPVFNSDISRWDVKNILDMSAMFAYTGSFSIDIRKWKVSTITKIVYNIPNSNILIYLFHNNDNEILRSYFNALKSDDTTFGPQQNELSIFFSKSIDSKQSLEKVLDEYTKLFYGDRDNEELYNILEKLVTDNTLDPKEINKNIEFIKLFIEKGIDINSTNINEGPRKGWSIKEYATEINNKVLLNFVNTEINK